MPEPELLAANLAALSAALALILVWAGMGARIRHLALGAHADAPLTAGGRWLVDVALGAGALGIILFTATAGGLGRSGWILAITGAFALLVAKEIARAAAGVWSAARRAAHEQSRAFAGLAVALLLTVLLAGAVAPPTEWDSLMYHLRIPLWILETGRIEVPPDSFHVGLIGVWHFATAPLLAAGLESGPAVMQTLALALVMLGTFELARAAGLGSGGRWVALAVFAGCPIFALVAITARVDVALVLPLLGAHLLLLDDRAPEHPRRVILAAVLIGIGLALKPLAAAYAVALIPLGWRASGGWRAASVAAVVALLVAAPWILKNQFLLDAALYPRGFAPRFEPWLAAIFGGATPPATFDTSVLLVHSESRASFNLLDAFVAPERLTIEGEGRHYALSPVLALVPLVLLVWRSRRTAAVTALIGLAYAALVVIPYGRINLRYLMPAIPALAVGAAAVAEALLGRLPPAARRAGFIIVALLALLPLGRALQARFGGDAVLIRHALGLASARDVWARHPDQVVRPLAPVIANVKQHVPADGRILMLWDSRALPLERDALVDVRLTNWSYLAQSPAIESCLRGTGITHVLVNVGAAAYYIRRGATAEAFRMADLDAFRERCVSQRGAVGPGFELMAVRPPAADTSR